MPDQPMRTPVDLPGHIIEIEIEQVGPLTDVASEATIWLEQRLSIHQIDPQNVISLKPLAAAVRQLSAG